MNKATLCILARQYVEATLKVKTTHSIYNPRSNDVCSYIGVTTADKRYEVQIIPHLDIIIAYEQMNYGVLSNVQKIFPNPVVVVEDFYHQKYEAEILDFDGVCYTAKICGTGNKVNLWEHDFEIK